MNFLFADGDADVLSASFGDDKIAWYENQQDGCTIHTTADLGFFVTPVIAGSSTFSIAVPNDPALIGYQLTAQATAASNSSVAFAGLAMSNGLRGTVGF
mgnify:CR=1 FL=1